MKEKKELKTVEVTKTETLVYDNCPVCDKEIRGKSESQVEYWMTIHNPGKGGNCNKIKKSKNKGFDFTKK